MACADAIASPAHRRRSAALFRYPEQPNFPPRYNVAPTQPVPIVRMAEGERRFRAGALGADPGLGEGSEGLHAPDQCARRIGQRQAGVPQRHEAPALPVSGRRLLRMEDAMAGASGPISRDRTGGGPLAFAGLVGNLDRTERRGDGDRRHRHHRRPTATLAQIHHRMPVIVRAGGVRLLARLRQGR